MSFKTPGVYPQAVSGYRPAAIPVETAVPAFIGYTEKIEDEEGNSLLLIPTRISSMESYVELFGKGPGAQQYAVELDLKKSYQVIDIQPATALGQAGKYHLFACLESYFANGGGPCFIITVGDYSCPITYDPYPAIPACKGLKAGLDAIEQERDPTLIAFPDAVSLQGNDIIDSHIIFGQLQQDALAQCARHQNRFAIFDIKEGYRKGGNIPNQDPIQLFRDHVGQQNLKYGAVYYPWLRTQVAAETIDISYEDLILKEAGGNLISPTMLQKLKDEGYRIGYSVETRNAVNALIDVALGDLSMNHTTASKTFLDQRFGFHTSQLAIAADPNKTYTGVRDKFNAMVAFMRKLVFALLNLENELAKNPDFASAAATIIDLFKNDTDLTDAIISWIALEKNNDFQDSTAHEESKKGNGPVIQIFQSLNGTAWIGSKNDVTDSEIPQNSADYGRDVKDLIRGIYQSQGFNDIYGELSVKLMALFTLLEDKLSQGIGAPVSPPLDAELEKQILSQALAKLQSLPKEIPPSATIAGIYCATDRSRGVWKAPANVRIQEVIGPVLPINEQEQSSLNIDETGKSVNALRAFPGQGTLVWGARTLQGNDQEWRYVPVRRLFNTVEAFVKSMTMAFVFQNNDGHTWIRLRAIIDNYLKSIWRKGALYGNSAGEAFFVKIGLGETMTQDDILNGRLIIEIGLAVARPAEFIIVQYEQQLQTG